ncbi:beta-glucanase protein [Rhizobium phage RHph_X2_28B]|uniref:beta-glucanase protein n=1 Tax=Rhizobium phage RHph_X2_28B TaxID=2836086 RepID=UPI0023297258|nr:beta-glucanase protein [Rhizobium phage RHph_X2_28B]QWY83487.1 beta-glucanase protein [Rhizobium phage RHph_X2_28B]QWY83723.1 beta-glucanase protein [Rhizobium phage RHph_X3_15]
MLTQFPATDITTSLDLLPRMIEVFTHLRDNLTPKVSMVDAYVLPNAMEARLKVRLSGSPRNLVQGTYLTRNGIGTNEGTNYVRTGGKFKFWPGQDIEQEIVIPLKGNNQVGDTIDCIISSTLQGASNGDMVGTVRFVDNIPAGVKAGFKLDWEHNFIDGFKVSDTGFQSDGSTCWQSRPHHGRDQVGNKELGLYVDPMIYPQTNPFPIVDGKRVLRSEKLETPIIYDGKSFNYTASMITTRKMRILEVGDRVEARYAMPVLGSRAAWPAFWLLATNDNWNNDYREIDGLEWPINATHNAWTYFITQHWRSSFGSHQQLSYPIDIRDSDIAVTEDLTNFHTYGIEVTQQEIRYDIDGKRTAVMENRAPTASWYVLLNMAFGGTWPGSPTVDTRYPNDMILDWIRFYKPL